MTQQEYNKFVEQFDNVLDMLRIGAEKQWLTFAAVFSVRRKNEENWWTWHRHCDATTFDLRLMEKEIGKIFTNN